MDSKKRPLIVFAVGGSGGHLFPARHLAYELIQSGYDVAFMGYGLSKSPFFQKEKFSYFDICSSPIVFKNPLKILRGIFKLIKGVKESKRILKRIKPQAVIGFGSYHSFPVILASYLLKIPYTLFEANATLGRVARMMGKKALFVSQTLLGGGFQSSSIPTLKVELPKALKREGREKALEYYDLSPKKLTILVFGGSQGAKAINAVVLEALKFIKMRASDLQVIHLIGNHDSKDKIEETYEKLSIQASVKVFEEHMESAWSIADLVIARAGASTVLEQLFYQVPAIYIPYPFASDNHQYHNAMFVNRHLMAARCFQEKELTAEALASAMDCYLADSYEVKQMKERIKEFYLKNSLPTLAHILIKKLNNLGPR